MCKFQNNPFDIEAGTWRFERKSSASLQSAFFQSLTLQMDCIQIRWLKKKPGGKSADLKQIEMETKRTETEQRQELYQPHSIS